MQGRPAVCKACQRCSTGGGNPKNGSPRMAAPEWQPKNGSPKMACRQTVERFSCGQKAAVMCDGHKGAHRRPLLSGAGHQMHPMRAAAQHGCRQGVC